MFRTHTAHRFAGAAVAAAGALAFAGHAAGQALPQLDNGIRNQHSEAGRPPDPEPPGPTERTGEQFAGATAFGGWVATRIKNGATVVAGSTNETAGAPGTILNPSFTPLAPDQVTPLTSQTIQLRSVKLGRPMVLRTVTFPLGSEIPRPDRKPDGTPLDPNVFAEAEFYFKEPANAASGKFYWSPHAQKVFATEPGVMEVQWEERVSGNIFTQRYTISGSPAKPPKTIYWTERDFNGPLVAVPEERVGEVNIIFNNLFQEQVAVVDSHDHDPDNPYDPENPGVRLPPERRTLWYDPLDNSIHAYNIEGRVFVELLGDLIEPQRIYREHLGFEIVDVVQEVRPDEVKVSIGEPVYAVDETELTPEEEALVPDVVAGISLATDPYLYEHVTLGGTKRNLFAVKETTPLRLFDLDGDGDIDEDDEQQSNEVLIYWKEAGVMDLLWPKSYVGYIFKWPEEYLAGEPTEADLRTFYSVYARPEAVADAQATGIQLASGNNPFVQYQDDETRSHAHLTPQNVFYTVPGTGNRSLIRYTNGEEIWFERVYSITNSDFEGYGTNLPAVVGDRIDPPAGIESAVGYIRQSQGDAFNVGAYLDPFLTGFDAAAEGAVIPVNALAGNDILEVWWYERNTAPENTSSFATVHWPSQVQRYRLQAPPLTLANIPMPASSVFTSAGALPTFHGTVGGIADADQKDATFVLDVDFLDKAAGNPECLFETGGNGNGLALIYDVGNVLRLGWRAGSLAEASYALAADELEGGTLQVAITISIADLNGDRRATLLIDGAEVASIVSSSLGADWSGSNGAGLGIAVIANSNAFNVELDAFTSGVIDLGRGLRYYGETVFGPTPAGGAHAIVMARNDGSGELGPAAGGSIYRQPDMTKPGANPNEEHALMSGGVAWALRDDLNSPASSAPFVLVDYTAADGRPAMVARNVYRELDANGDGDLADPEDVTFNYEAPVGVVLQAPMPLPVIPLPINEEGVVMNQEVAGAPTDSSPTPGPAGSVDYDQFTYVDRKGTTWIYRGPHGAGVNVGSVSDPTKNFRMHYRYKVADGFDFPGVASPPALGTIVPYLRAPDGSGGFVGDAVGGTPLEITFTPVWPANPAVLNVAESLGLPKRGLPAVRGQISANLLYQQSLAADGTDSASLFDPTRAKTYKLSATGLAKLPGSIATSIYQGKTYFPNLPPHLSERLFFDPNIGDKGALVFVGEFIDAPLGEDYFLLNVMSPKDVADAKALADTGDTDKAKWDTAIDGLSTTMETFKEDPSRRGTYIVDTSKNRSIGVSQLATVNDDNTPVDSYAISAAGGGTGYVVMAAGDGAAFTPDASPISLEVFKVAPPLYRGELKVIESANPLDEKLTLRHSGDFAGDPSDYEFAWLTAQPVSGNAPILYTFAALEVLGNGAARSWQFLNNPAAGYTAARNYAFDDSAWATPGSLDANLLVIDDGDGAAANGSSLPNAVLRDTLDWAGGVPIDLYASINIAPNDGAAVFINGAEALVWNVPGRENSVATTAPGEIAGDVLDLVFAVAPETLGAQNTITVDLYTQSDPGAESSFDLRLDARQETANLGGWQELTAGAKAGSGESAKVSHTIEGPSLFTLTDNYFTLRYRAKSGTAAAGATGGGAATPGEWSRWMPAQFAPGWIKRALAGINPFEQRVTDLFNNAVNTDVSLITQAGPRWEGNIALNLDVIDDFGLIEIYETVLNRGKDLSIDGAPPLNVPAANDALLLAAGYLNDLYMLLGNEAYADAANPTVAFSTDGEFGIAQFGEFNTALYAFKGQLASVMDEELTLLRGRDDRLAPGVQLTPVYNRLVWNFTNGIDSGEAVYALNYNIKDSNADGAADAVDAAEQYPQGHGDAYGHYLTALKGYYGLLNSDHFAWTPRIEAASVLGQPVSVDYQDERKFAAAAAALARTASQTLDLTYRQQFEADPGSGWSHLSDGELNESTGNTRYWGTDEWAARAGQGAFFHWVTANSILPEEDAVNEGIEKVDRTTVPELDEVVAQAEAIQQTLDNADGRLNPLGLAAGALSFDISPAEIDAGKTHYEQVFDRAVAALKNAGFAFDNAKDTTELLRRQDDTLDARVHAIGVQEAAYETELVEIYGTPYPDDIGPGRTYAQGYEGPDYLHYAYVEIVEREFDPSGQFKISFDLDPKLSRTFSSDGSETLSAKVTNDRKVEYVIDAYGQVVKPAAWSGSRRHPGQLQTAYSNVLAARHKLRVALDDYATLDADLDLALDMYTAALSPRAAELSTPNQAETDLDTAQGILVAAAIIKETTEVSGKAVGELAKGIKEAFPRVLGFSNDATSAGRAAALIAGNVAKLAFELRGVIAEGTIKGQESQIRILEEQLDNAVAGYQWQIENAQLVQEIKTMLNQFGGLLFAIDASLRELDQAERDLSALIARGDRIQAEREVFRKRAAAIIQGYRTRDLAFRVYRDEALEKYKTLFDLAARYTYLAARAYDYETGLLDATGSSAAAGFFESIVESRALGVLDAGGRPQFSASTTGDPGLAGVLAQMEGDWSVAKTRLGFNNPDRYRTTFSLREENYRIVPGAEGDGDWRDQLTSYRMADVLDDPDVRRHALQIGSGDGLPVPGIVIPFQTTITDGVNFFGQPLAGGDHGFSPSSFATKIRASGIAFDGYIGMDDPASNGGAVAGAGGQSPPDPDLGFLDPDALSATPYIYLIPVGADSMRSPPLGDTGGVRTWTVDDQAIPLPFNIGNSDFSTNPSFQSADSLTEAPFQIRKHQAFRAVPSGTVFSSAPGFTNSRLVGRSVWNSNWKIVIPGKTLRADAEVGLDVFLETVKDIELFLETYSYSGN